MLQVASLEFQVVSVEVDLELTSLSQSVEFSLKMQEFITVSSVTASHSHSDTTSYKNLTAGEELK